MKIKTSELTEAALDWAVAKCLEIEWWAAEDPRDGLFFDRDRTMRFSPSTNWSQGGPIFERERINPEPFEDINGEQWCANGEWDSPTPLIAAMRCFVASRLGDEVDIPEELT
jgi:hypothetical protein